MVKTLPTSLLAEVMSFLEDSAADDAANVVAEIATRETCPQGAATMVAQWLNSQRRRARMLADRVGQYATR